MNIRSGLYVGGLSRSDIDIHRLPRALLSESDCQLLENLMAQFKCGTEEFKMSAADLFAGGGKQSKEWFLSGFPFAEWLQVERVKV